MKPTTYFSKLSNYISNACRQTYDFLKTDIHMGRNRSFDGENAIVIFPVRMNTLFCGLAGIVSYGKGVKPAFEVAGESLNLLFSAISEKTFSLCKENNHSLKDHYLAGESTLSQLKTIVHRHKNDDPFIAVFNTKTAREMLQGLSADLGRLVAGEENALVEQTGFLDSAETDIVSKRIEDLKDIRWTLEAEILKNIDKITGLLCANGDKLPADTIRVYKKINAVLNAIDRLEVRGRDSAGISILFVFEKETFDQFKKKLAPNDPENTLSQRTNRDVLKNNGISINENAESQHVTMTMTYKIAAEIGSLGDNVSFLRHQIQKDGILKKAASTKHVHNTVTAHTRWASVGEISEANCHPVDNETRECKTKKTGLIHVSLNGDIDNYLELKKEYENQYGTLQENITTDTKIIPMQIEMYLKKGHRISEAFLMAVNDFEGSHAIVMHTDLSPGKLFLAQKGSGQAIFVGIADDHFMPTSEIYGFIEETNRYIKMDGESIFHGKNGDTQGQIFVLSHSGKKGSPIKDPTECITAMYYDGTPIPITEKNIQHTKITSRDIDRQGFSHYFLKEITESPVSVEKTLLNRWKVKPGTGNVYMTALDQKTLPDILSDALSKNTIRRIYFTGQGTAGVAALACANIMNYYLNDPLILVKALKASELSGFILNDTDKTDAMKDALVIAISQSGTTTDTNRAVDMVKTRGARTLAIVNRRDSDLTFKVDGIIYTSSGRDIEMSVASTKAFYSQIVAGAILSLHIAGLKGARDEAFVSEEIKSLLKLPGHMRKILGMRSEIETSAQKHAVKKTYWAVVGSGPNKASSDEIRIKLSELCYKTISSDYVEDKKHIDLSSEPLIIVCAAGTRENVLGDIIKDTAIFNAHKALPIVITDEGENRFAPYAADVFHVPKVSEHLAPVLNTLVGHLWGYYAALSINEGSKFMYDHSRELKSALDDYASQGLNVYEVLVERGFREQAAQFYQAFRDKKNTNGFPAIMGFDSVANLSMLLKYLTGRLPVTDFEFDFGKKGTANNIIQMLFESMSDAINFLARPVDAIKHQAKTVTVGTSRISEKIEGLLFEAIAYYKLSVSQLTNSNVIVLKNLQNVVSGINGSILYRIGGLNLLGEPTDETTIDVLQKDGILKDIPSRVESDTRLKGTKQIIVRQGNVYIGTGRKDSRSILVIPAVSTDPSKVNVIEYLLLLNISFRENVPLFNTIKALGGKYEHIKNIVQENSINWDDSYLETIDLQELFGKSAEKVGEKIIADVNGR
ncbi:MAG: SIS domain-containing protein [Proteobacteria bacterium]|nr:SIS domain-containing protein [Pseudomonadota bacterium]